MKKETNNLKIHHLVVVASFFLIGMTMIMALDGYMRLAGFIIVVTTLIYFAARLFQIRGRIGDKYKSQTREQILKHQYKR